MSSCRITESRERRYFEHGNRLKEMFISSNMCGDIALLNVYFGAGSDDGSLPLVKKICDSMVFLAANCFRVLKVPTPSCFSVLPLLPIMKRVTVVNQ